MRIGISGTHGTGKTTLVDALSEHLGYESVDEPYYLLEEEGHEFQLPPSIDDYREMVAASVRTLHETPGDAIFDRTPLDYLAYQAALGAPVTAPSRSVREAVETLDLLVVTVITAETERVLPAAEQPGLRQRTNDTLLELLDDVDVPVLELDMPLEDRLAACIRAVHPR